MAGILCTVALLIGLLWHCIIIGVCVAGVLYAYRNGLPEMFLAALAMAIMGAGWLLYLLANFRWVLL